VRRSIPLLIALVAALLLARPSAAHTESDVVAVPAGGEAAVTFRPTHGCAGIPTVEVSVRAPVEGASAGPVDGWQETAEPDGDGHTILKWTGGLLPADQVGAFPITFLAPDAVGDLLTFPAVQICENDEELAWIDGDPAGEYPAPRLLVLPAGSEAAATVDEVPADAPGRDQLTEIVEVDDHTHEEDAAAPSTTEAADSRTTAPGASTTTTAPAEEEAAAPVDAGGSEDGGAGGGVSALAIGIVVLGALVVAGYMVMRRRTQPS
jgi:uncharacterized protein YcnI